MATNTPNYNLDKYEATDVPNLLDQYNASMDKIDTAMKGVENQAVNGYAVANEAKQQATEAQQSAATAQTNASEALQQVATKAQINHASADATYGAASDTMYGHMKLYSAKGSNVDGTMTQAAITDALSSVVTKVNTNDIYDGAVTTDKIADGAVTAPKLDASAIESLLNGMSIRFFSSEDDSLDNDGLSVPSGVKLSGFYIENLELLVLTQLSSSKVAVYVDSGITLPSYIRPETILSSFGSLLVYTDSSNYETWTGIKIKTDGKIQVNTAITPDRSSCLFGTLVFCLRNNTKSLYNSPKSNYYKQNGVYNG